MFMTMSYTKTDGLQNLRLSMHLMNITNITQNNPVKALLDLAFIVFLFLFRFTVNVANEVSL